MQAFLTGVFLGSGSVSVPTESTEKRKYGYHFEIDVETRNQVDLIAEIFSNFDIFPKVVERGEELIIYFKDSETICDVLGLFGANKIVLDLMNKKVDRDMNNMMNRQVNCISANLDKTINASLKQIKAIEVIRDTIGIESLPDTLCEAALLRLSNPEASLSDLLNLMETKELEMRTLDVVFSTTDETGVIEGRPVVYNSRADIGMFDEIIESGALNNTDLTDVRFCLNHDTSFVYARSRRNNANSTMQLVVDEQGLGMRAVLDIENSSRARDLYSAIKRGDIDKMSFMFGVRGDKWDDIDSEHPTRHITDVSTVVEVSAVTFPAYNATSINARSKEALDNARAALESERKQSADAVETVRNNTLELELLKEKTKFFKGLN